VIVSVSLLLSVAPIVAGTDKFFQLLVNWDQYLAPVIAGLLPINPHTFMLVIGVIEVVAGIIVAVKPSVGGLIVAASLWGHHRRPAADPRILRHRAS
jgi:hypothetical protein